MSKGKTGVEIGQEAAQTTSAIVDTILSTEGGVADAARWMPNWKVLQAELAAMDQNELVEDVLGFDVFDYDEMIDERDEEALVVSLKRILRRQATTARSLVGTELLPMLFEVIAKIEEKRRQKSAEPKPKEETPNAYAWSDLTAGFLPLNGVAGTIVPSVSATPPSWTVLNSDANVPLEVSPKAGSPVSFKTAPLTEAIKPNPPGDILREVVGDEDRRLDEAKKRKKKTGILTEEDEEDAQVKFRALVELLKNRSWSSTLGDGVQKPEKAIRTEVDATKFVYGKID